MTPKIIQGGTFVDSRGKLTFNNNFNATKIKRIYTIENKEVDFRRGWQGHKIEQRWFSAIKGAFKIQLIAIDDWDNPSKDLRQFKFEINDAILDVLHAPAGYVNCIQPIEEGSKLLVMADFLLGEVRDEYRFELDYFL